MFYKEIVTNKKSSERKIDCKEGIVISYNNKIERVKIVSSISYLITKKTAEKFNGYYSISKNDGELEVNFLELPDVEKIKNSCFTENYNILKILDKFLQYFIKHEIENKNIPNIFYILSSNTKKEINVNEKFLVNMRRIYTLNGYIMPSIVYWNCSNKLVLNKNNWYVSSLNWINYINGYSVAAFKKFMNGNINFNSYMVRYNETSCESVISIYYFDASIFDILKIYNFVNDDFNINITKGEDNTFMLKIIFEKSNLIKLSVSSAIVKIFIHFDIDYEQIYFYNFNQDNKLYIKKILEYEYEYEFNNNRISN